MFDLIAAPFRYDVVSVVLPHGSEEGLDMEIELLRNYWREEKFKKLRWR
jgi:hypothetical protein